MSHTSSHAKGCLTAAGLLLFGLTRVQGQTVDGTQVIGYLNSSDVNDMTDLANSNYTTFIDGFLTPTTSSTAANPSLAYDAPAYYANTSELSSQFVSGINTVENAGKNVLVSFGGADVTSAEYAAFAATPAATQTLANILSAYVTNAPSYVNATTGATVAITTVAPGSSAFKGFSGIDLDYEDTAALNGTGTYDGTKFIANLTNDLAANFAATGKSYILTQAPQAPYLLTSYTSANAIAAYQAIVTASAGGALTAAGKNTTWLNVQFYNNPSYDGNNSVAGVVSAFETMVQNNPGLPTSKLVLTLPLYATAANDNFFTNTQVEQIIEGINSYLTAHGDGTIAGVAGFELYDPAFYNNNDQAGQDAYNNAFADSVVQADVVPEPSTCAFLAVGALGLVWMMRLRTAVRR